MKTLSKSSRNTSLKLQQNVFSFLCQLVIWTEGSDHFLGVTPYKREKLDQKCPVIIPDGAAEIPKAYIFKIGGGSILPLAKSVKPSNALLLFPHKLHWLGIPVGKPNGVGGCIVDTDLFILFPKGIREAIAGICHLDFCCFRWWCYRWLFCLFVSC